jgi:CrcB protein
LYRFHIILFNLQVMFKNLLLIGSGGALGSIARYAISQLTKRYWLHAFPMGTFLVNALGCLLIGLLIGYYSKINQDGMKLLLITGFCGGFTTFSSFASENIALIQQNQMSTSVLYILGSIFIGLLFVWIGISLMKA